MDNWQIRSAVASDMDCLAKIYLQSRIASGCFLPIEELKYEDFYKDIFDEEVYVYEINQKVIGFISIYPPDLFIHLLFVHPDYFAQGVGKRLLTFAKSRYGLPLTLKCLVNNQKAMQFYEQFGFIQQQMVQTAHNNCDYYIYCLRK